MNPDPGAEPRPSSRGFPRAGPLTIAIAGATGAVGRELCWILSERDFPVGRLHLLAGPNSPGRKMRVLGSERGVAPLEGFDFSGVDLAFFSCGGERSERHVPRALDAGALVIDNSSAFRMDRDVPLVVPECNEHALFRTDGGPASSLIANPNCSTILMALVLAPLHRAFGLRRVIAATYQAASGAGARALAALEEDLAAGFDGGVPRGEAWRGRFPHPLAGNLIPQIDRFLEDGSTREEWKMEVETRKILDLPDLRVEACCVRVPVLRSHAEALVLETDRECPPLEARRVLEEAPGLSVVDDRETFLYPMPLETSGRDEVQVGRIRASRAFRNGLSLFLAGDQIRKGAALNAVQIAECLLRASRGDSAPRDPDSRVTP